MDNSNDANAVINRVKVALGVGSDAELARVRAINPQTLSNWRSRGSVPYSLAVDVAVETGQSLDFILMGVDAPAPSVSDPQLAEPAQTYNHDTNDVLTDSERDLLDLYHSLTAAQQAEFLNDGIYRRRVSALERELGKFEPQNGGDKKLR
jgi:hypothetical protein